MTDETAIDVEPGTKRHDTIAPVAAIAAALKSGAQSMPIAPISVGVGIGSAALMGALLYANRKRPGRDRG